MGESMSSFQEILVSDIQASPFNPRKSFEGARFDDLVASIRQKGVLEPVLVRPKNGGFELVAGERRWRAVRQISEENGKDLMIPAMVRDLDDDDAFDAMMIENLLREDLNEREEAEGFKAYLDRHAKGNEGSAVAELASRTGITPQYIRRRVAVLSLPAEMVQAWEDGQVLYGHLEQLLRVEDEEWRAEIFSEAVHYNVSVKNIKNEIDSARMTLSKAKFDIEVAGCPTCAKNSEVQIQLFGLGDKDNVLCSDPKCYRQKLNNYLLANWKKMKTGTNGFRFSELISFSEYRSFFDKVEKECKKCESFVSLIGNDGTIRNERACVGPEKCYRKIYYGEGDDNGSGKESLSGSPDWHGTYFREVFFKTAITERVNTLSRDDIVVARMTLYALLLKNQGLHPWFNKQADLKKEDDGYYGPYFSPEEVWQAVEGMSLVEVREALKEAALQTFMDYSYQTTMARRLVAEHLGVSLQQEWTISEEYLKKKTKAQIIEIGKEVGVLESTAALEYLARIKRKDFNSCKKKELIDVFLKSGINLAGRVPAEILDRKDVYLPGGIPE